MFYIGILVEGNILEAKYVSHTTIAIYVYSAMEKDRICSLVECIGKVEILFENILREAMRRINVKSYSQNLATSTLPLPEMPVMTM